MIRVFVDDIHPPESIGWNHTDAGMLHVCRTYQEAKELIDKLVPEINSGKYVEFSFDHDIASYDENGKELNGYMLMCILESKVWFEEIKYQFGIQYHTDNPSGIRDMRGAITGITKGFTYYRLPIPRERIAV